MEKQMKMVATGGGGDRLSELPDSILIHILSMLWDSYEVVRTSVLSTRWQLLWMSVPASVAFEINPSDNDEVILDFHEELRHWKWCEKIRNFSVWSYDESRVQDVDSFVRFATQLANVEEFMLEIKDFHYKFPQFAYKSTSLRNLYLCNCQLNPYGSVNWPGIVSLSFTGMDLTDGLMEKVLSGCANLECLDLLHVTGIYRLEITSLKLRELRVQKFENEDPDLWLEIVAPNLQKLELSGFCHEICIQQRNVASLVTALLDLDFSFDDEEGNLEKECRYWKELLHSVAHVKNLQLGPSCVEFLSILELRGWQSPPSSRKFLELSGDIEQSDFPGICSFLQSSPDLETLDINWHMPEPSQRLLSQYTNMDEQNMRFETHNFNFSLPQLRTIQIKLFFHGPLSVNKFILSLAKYFLKNATALEKFLLQFDGRGVRQDFDKMTQELLSFPRSSPHAQLSFLIEEL